jgi:type VI secretion system lysozyme-like protein
MAGGYGLLDRMRARTRQGERTAKPRPEHLYESIQLHLIRLLNTREGDSNACPDYGLPALTDVNCSGRGEEMRRRIEQSIRTYEPRLAGVAVRCVEPDPFEPLKLRFQISGRPKGMKKRLTFRFDTAVSAVGGSGWKVTG